MRGKMKRDVPTGNRKKLVYAWSAILLVLVILASVSGGCVNKILKTDPDTEPPAVSDTPDPTQMTGSSGDAPVPPGIANQEPVAQMTPVKSDIVTEVAPIVTPDPYPILHGTRINATPFYRFIDRQPEFEKTYILRGNATGLLVNVVEGPLYIVYTVKPQNDCLLNPDSCRGDMEKPVQRPYLTITVRDNETHDIIAEDGYGREYSSDIGTYSISITTTSSEDGETTTTSSEPGPRRIVVYKEGVFHVTMEGNYLDVDLSIITGSSPDPLEVSSEKQSGQSASPTPPPEEEWW
jgi:hypothetical protein